MAGVNKVILIGNLTRDPELRYTPKGTAVTELGLAVNRRYRVEEEMREETTFVDVTFWGAQAETISKYVQKGTPIYIEGRLQLDTWDDKTSGQKRSKMRVVGEGFQFLGGGGKRSFDEGGDEGGSSSGPMRRSSAPSERPAASTSSSAPPPASFEEEEEDDIPF